MKFSDFTSESLKKVKAQQLKVLIKKYYALVRFEIFNRTKDVGSLDEKLDTHLKVL